jgi:CubicO group peptidase (beta-lactamase class C family)
MYRIKKKVFFSLSLLLTACIAATQCYSQNYSTTIWSKAIDTKIKKEMLRNHVTGVAIGIVDSGKIVYAKGFGYSDLLKRRQITDTTSFHIASLSKSFTALAIMQLVEQNKLNIDIPVRQYLPELKFEYETFPNGADFTSREVMCHLSGLPNDIWNQFGEFQVPDKKLIIQNLNKLGAFGPRNTNFAYSNIGYGLLTLLIEKISGISYADYLQENIFVPLQMKNTFVYGEQGEEDFDLSYGFRRGHSYREPFFRDVGAISICSSISDLGNYITMFLQHGRFNEAKLLDSTLIHEMFDNHLTALPLQEYQGYGLGLDSDQRKYNSEENTRNIMEIGHFGATDLFHSGMKFYPDLGCGFIVLTNSKNGVNMQDPNLLSDSYLKHQYKAKIENLEEKQSDHIVSAFLNFLDPSVDSVQILEDEEEIKGLYNLSNRLLRIKNTRRFPIYLDGRKGMAKAIGNGQYIIGEKFLGIFYRYYFNYILEFLKYKNQIYLRADDKLNTRYTYFGVKQQKLPFISNWESHKGKYFQDRNNTNTPYSPFVFHGFKMSLKKRGSHLLVVVRDKSGQLYSKTYMNTLDHHFAHCFSPIRNNSDALRILPNGNLYYQGAEFYPKKQRN